MPDEQDLIRKISGLLAKAEGTDNEHEANAFFAKAHELMVNYAIEEERVRASRRNVFGTADEPIVVDFMYASYAHHAKAKAALLEVVCRAQHVRAFMYDNRKGSYDKARLVREAGHTGLYESQWVKLVGYEADIAHVKMLFTSLLIQSQKFANDDWRAQYGDAKTTNPNGIWDKGEGKFMWLSGHMDGFSERIGDRFDELTAAIYEQVKDATSLIQDKDANILEWMYEHGILSRPRQYTPVYYCYVPEPEENRPMRADGRTPQKKWRPAYCMIVKVDADTPHEGPHVFTYKPDYRYTSVSYYEPKGRRESREGRAAGRSAAERADIGLTRTGSGAKHIKG